MPKIILDAELRSKLNGLNEQLELCADDGTTLGRFVPEAVFQRIIYANLKQHHTDAEAKELGRQTGGSTLQEIADELNAAGHRTTNGKLFAATTVRRIKLQLESIA